MREASAAHPGGCVKPRIEADSWHHTWSRAVLEEPGAEGVALFGFLISQLPGAQGTLALADSPKRLGTEQ